MADQPTPTTGDAAIDALFAEIDDALAEWGRSIDRMEATADRLLDLAAIDEEWSC